MSMPPPMTKQAVSQWLGVSRQVIDRLVAEGLPCTTDEKGRQRFDPREIGRWLLARGEATGGGPAVDKQRERLLKAQADRAELELAKARGELVEAEAVRLEWSTSYRTIRDILRIVPMSIVDQAMAASAEGRVALKGCLQEAIDDALRRAAHAPHTVRAEIADDAA